MNSQNKAHVLQDVAHRYAESLAVFRKGQRYEFHMFIRFLEFFDKALENDPTLIFNFMGELSG